MTWYCCISENEYIVEWFDTKEEAVEFALNNAEIIEVNQFDNCKRFKNGREEIGEPVRTVWRRSENILRFDTIEELRECKALQNMSRYSFTRAVLQDKEVIVCATDQIYEDIIWNSLMHNIFLRINSKFGTEVDAEWLATECRDFILDKLEENGVKFVNVFEEY